MHRVGRGEERVVIPDRNIGRVVKVAPSALRPRPAQPPGRDGDLTFVRANDRLERDPSGPSRVAACFYVVEHRRLRARGKSILSAIAGTSQFAVRLIADGGQPRVIREVGAVRDDRGIDPAVGEPTRLEMHLEIKLQRFAGPERCLQGINPVAEAPHRKARSWLAGRSGRPLC